MINSSRDIQHAAQNEGNTMPWWGIVLVGAGGAAVGGVAVYIGVMTYISKAMSRR